MSWNYKNIKDKKMTKVFKFVLGTAIALFLAAYLFNHVNAWVGVLFIACVLYLVFRRIDKEIDKNN